MTPRYPAPPTRNRVAPARPCASTEVVVPQRHGGRAALDTDPFEGNPADPIIANSATIGAARLFDIVDQGNGNVTLRAHANNQWVCAENAGAAALIANRASVGRWETFQLIQNPDGSVPRWPADRAPSKIAIRRPDPPAEGVSVPRIAILLLALPA